MEITYLGHAAFRLKGKQGTVVTDPYDASVGMKFPSVAADVVTVSHDHPDHSNSKAIGPTARREPWIVRAAGEYEVAGISVFGFSSFHDATQGSERGANVIYSIIVDGVNIVHLGDLGHELSQKTLEELGNVDVLLCPVGGVYSLGPKEASEVIQAIEPSYVIPMHYKTDAHNQEMFGSLATVEEFQKVYGVSVEPTKSLSVNANAPTEQTTLVVLTS